MGAGASTQWDVDEVASVLAASPVAELQPLAETARQRGVEVADQGAGEVAPRLAVGAALALRRGVGLEQVGDARLQSNTHPVHNQHILAAHRLSGQRNAFP